MPCWPVPIGSLRMWVVGVAPVGRYHRFRCHSKAVFSCAPASEIRNESGSCWPMAGAVAPAKISATPAGVSGSPVISRTDGAGSSSLRSCKAPMQSRPISSSRSNAPVDAVWNRRWILSRICRLSGSRLSKYASTFSRYGSREGRRGKESEIGRRAGDSSHDSA